MFEEDSKLSLWFCVWYYLCIRIRAQWYGKGVCIHEQTLKQIYINVDICRCQLQKHVPLVAELGSTNAALSRLSWTACCLRCVVAGCTHSWTSVENWCGFWESIYQINWYNMVISRGYNFVWKLRSQGQD